MNFCLKKRWFLITVFESTFMLGIKIWIVLKSELNGLHENVNLGFLEAEKLQKPRWPKYCETTVMSIVGAPILKNKARS